MSNPDGNYRQKLFTEHPVNPEVITDNQLGALISAIGNNEAKAIGFLAMEEGRIYSRHDFWRSIMQAQGQNIGWNINASTPYAWCERSFAPIGLVAAEVIDRQNNSYGYIKTELGENSGNPLVGLLLDFSFRNPDISLSDLFGSANSSSHEITDENKEVRRSPSLRFKIYRILTQQRSPLREIDIVNILGEDNSTLISKHLLELRKAGIITYDSIGRSERYSFYKLATVNKPDVLPHYYTYTKLADYVYTLISTSPERWWSIHDLTDIIIENSPERATSRDSLFGQISVTLSVFLKNGLVQVEKFRAGNQSEILLNEQQRTQLEELVTFLSTFQAGDISIIDTGNRLARDVLADCNRVSQLMGKARENSSYANRTLQAENNTMFLEILGDTPNLTSEELRELLEQRYGKNLSRASINHLLMLLEDRGLIARQTSKVITRWSLKDTSTQEF